LALEIKRARKTGFTLAPEAGTSRLRAVINKDLTEEDLFGAAETAFSLGWQTLKLYFMTGLPTETEEDLEAIGNLTRKIKKMSRAKINLGLAHFTPKAHTPFQWYKGSTALEIKERLFFVKSNLRIPGISAGYSDPGASWAEALLSRGDRRMAQVLEKVFKLGGHFEAWNDYFVLDYWQKALSDNNLSEEYLLRERPKNEILPWDHLSAGVTKDFLLSEWDLALKGESTPDCRHFGCHHCGACHDGAKIDLAINHPEEQIKEPLFINQPQADPLLNYGTEPSYQRHLARFSKKGSMALLSHLETVEVFKRAFRRSNITLALSQGFHPQPKLSFPTALALGVESLDEPFYFSLTKPLPSKYILENIVLPQGLTLLEVKPLPKEAPRPKLKSFTWEITSKEPLFNQPPLQPAAPLIYTDKKNRVKKYALENFVLKIDIISPYIIRLDIKVDPLGTPKPQDIIKTFWELDSNFKPSVKKITTVLE
jgi:radical SAM-linked protein